MFYLWVVTKPCSNLKIFFSTLIIFSKRIQICLINFENLLNKFFFVFLKTPLHYVNYCNRELILFTRSCSMSAWTMLYFLKSLNFFSLKPHTFCTKRVKRQCKFKKHEKYEDNRIFFNVYRVYFLVLCFVFYYWESYSTPCPNGGSNVTYLLRGPGRDRHFFFFFWNNFPFFLSENRITFFFHVRNKNNFFFSRWNKKGFQNAYPTFWDMRSITLKKLNNKFLFSQTAK